MFAGGVANNATLGLLAEAAGLKAREPDYYPFYHVPRTDIFPFLSDKYVSLFITFFTYWVVSLLFHAIDNAHWPVFDRYRIHAAEEYDAKNKVTVSQVIWAVLLQQGIQTVLGLIWLEEDDPAHGPFRDHAGDILSYETALARMAVALLGNSTGWEVMHAYGHAVAQWAYWWGVPLLQFLAAALVLDAWQYGWHRYFHVNKFLYRHIHSWHHRLYVPYAFGALYNHPLEGFMFDSLGAVIAHGVTRMTMRQGILFFAISTAKTVDDHCGYNFPWDPLQILFANNADYHDIHHQIGGLKKNFSQPYFIHFDYFLGTRMTRAELEAKSHRSQQARKALEKEKELENPTGRSSSGSSEGGSPPPLKQEANGPNELDPVPTSRRRGKALKVD